MVAAFALSALLLFVSERCSAAQVATRRDDFDDNASSASDALQSEEGLVVSADEAEGTDLHGAGDETVSKSDVANDDHERKAPRITLLGLDDTVNLERSSLIGLGADGNGELPPRLNYNQLHANDMAEDSFYDPFSADPSCVEENTSAEGRDVSDCWHPPDSTVEEEIVSELVTDCDDGGNSAGLETLAWGYGGADPDDTVQEEQEDAQDEGIEDGADADIEGGNEEGSPRRQPPEKANLAPDEAKCEAKTKAKVVDKHWGSDIDILKMRDRLRGRRGKCWDSIKNETEKEDVNDERARQKTESESPPRPPVFLLPGLASTRLVSWKHKPCPQSTLLSDIKMLDYVWLNMNLLIQMATIDARCWTECMTLGKYQSDGGVVDETDPGSKDGGKESQPMHGCKLRPDEGLDSISSLAPGTLSSNLIVGGTNTVYAWLIQWLADNLGYDVNSIVALPYDWRLSPDVMEGRDGFLTMTRKKIEAAVESNGRPGIMVAHSMGNSVFRYFLKWLRVSMREEAYERYVHQATHAATTRETERGGDGRGPFWRGRALYRSFVFQGGGGSIAEDNGGDDSVTEDTVDDEMAYAWLFGSNNDNDQSKSKQEAKRKTKYSKGDGSRRFPKLYELAKAEGDTEWIEWLGKHIWTYVALAAPLLGGPGPLRSVLSGENMGLPFTDEEARGLELSFGSTSTVNPISTKMGFCDGEDVDNGDGSNLACLEELIGGIEMSKGKSNETNPWKNFPALRLLLKDRVDFDSLFPMVQVSREFCSSTESSPCNNQTNVAFGAKDVMNGNIFRQFSQIWNEKDDPLGVKLDQLRQSWWHNNVPNMLETTPDRPHIKHVILAYGTDVPTEIGYVYRKKDLVESPTVANMTSSSSKKSHGFDGVPSMTEVIWEEPHGRLARESKLVEPASFAKRITRKKKSNRRPLVVNGIESPAWLHHSGDGTIPYISLMWAHTWLLHATRATRTTTNMTSMLEGERISDQDNALDSIIVTHRPKGGSAWMEGYGADPRDKENGDFESPNDSDTGTSHPHGTKYKPKMVRFQSSGKSRSTGMEYTTTVIEAIGVEHKETTRNYDILAAAFTDVLKNLSEDYGDI